jgi:hypothetical protein
MDRTGLPSNAMRDVRVTAKVSTPRDFIAPELSPVSTHNVEMAKGVRGFTNMDVKVETLPTPATERIKRDMRNVKAMTVGTRVIRHKASSGKHVVPTTGPTSAREQAMARAKMLAERDGYNWD